VGERGFSIETVGFIDWRHMFSPTRKRRHLEIDLDSEHPSRIDHDVGSVEDGLVVQVVGHLRNLDAGGGNKFNKRTLPAAAAWPARGAPEIAIEIHSHVCPADHRFEAPIHKTE
jgi:hypothetical protein